MKLSGWVLAFGAATASLSYAEQTSTTPQARVVLTLPDGRDFTLPVPSSPSEKHVIGMVPVSKGSLVGIRMVPRMQSGQVTVEVAALLGEPTSPRFGLTCAQVRNWSRQETLGTYSLNLNDTLALADLARYALPALQLRAEQVAAGAGASPNVCPDYCCCLGLLKCCPEYGKCIDCGGSAVCCYGP